MADTGTPIHIRISEVREKNITHEQPAQDHKCQQADAVQMQAHSAATEAVQCKGAPAVATEAVQSNAASQSITGARSSAAVPFKGPSPAEAVPFNGASQVKAGTQSSAAAVKKLHLLCRGVPATEAAVKAGTQFSAASLAKAGARPSAAAAAVVHHEEDKFTGLNSGRYKMCTPV